MTIEDIRRDSVYTTDIELMKQYSVHPDMCVRRNLTFNVNTPTEIINELTKDAVMNVAFGAYKHRNCTKHRTFHSYADVDHPCVQCDTIDYSRCSSCFRPIDYRR